jgi:putative membrane protein
MLNPVIEKNDRKAMVIIFSLSIIVFLAVALLNRFKLNVDLGFNPHVFAKFNAVINATVAFLLITALVAVKNKNYKMHKNIMLLAMVLSTLFLVSYILHHGLSGDTMFGDSNHDGKVDDTEKALVGSKRIIYLLILLTHIPLAAIILPFILYSVYRGLTGEFDKHKKLVRYTWPIWFYVSVTGVIVYLMISPYYS